MTGKAITLPAPGAAHGIISTLTTRQLDELHAALYGDIMRRLDALERRPPLGPWSPKWRAEMKAARLRRMDLVIIGAEMITRIRIGEL